MSFLDGLKSLGLDSRTFGVGNGGWKNNGRENLIVFSITFSLIIKLRLTFWPVLRFFDWNSFYFQL